MSQEIIFVELCQSIQDEITRLEQSRTDYNLFVGSSDLKIQILNRLLQLILTPENLSKEDLDKYFKDAESGAHVAKTLPELIDILLNDTTVCKVTATGKITAVRNQALIDENRNIFSKKKDPTKNHLFYEDLKRQFEGLKIAPPTITNYSLRRNKKTVNPITDKGKLFVEWDEKKKELNYTVINPQGETITSALTKTELKKQLGARYDAFHELVVQEHLPVPFLFDILQITSQKGDTYPVGPQRTFNRVIYLGDSLTDKGKMYDSILGAWSGLIGTSPHKSFSNAPVWAVGIDNYMAIELLKKVVAEHLGIKGYRNFGTCSSKEREAIQDAIADMDKHLRDKYKASFGLDNDNRFTIKDSSGQDVVFSITKAIGGLTAYSYAGKLSINPARTITRLLLSTLAKQREELLEDEKNTPPEERAKTVVHILAGANDLVTVNARPSHEEVDHAVEAIIETMEILWQNGYRQFTLSDLPDLSKTPRYQYESRVEQLNARMCSEYFNRQLSMRLAQFKSLHLDSAVDVFGLHDLLQDGINNPSKYGFSTRYDLEKVDKEQQWKELSYHSEGCSFFRVPPTDSRGLVDLWNKIQYRAYVRMGDGLYYIDKKLNNKFTLILSGKDEMAQFDEKIKCADAVKMLPENKLENISKMLREKAVEENTPPPHHFNPSLQPHTNKIYYQIKGNEFHYQVMDAYDRLRKDKVTEEELLSQMNGCAVLRTSICPVTDEGQVRIDIPAGSAYVRYEDKLYYIRRSDDDFKKFIVAQEITLTDEQYDEFDAHFKPWYASRQLTEAEQAKCCKMFPHREFKKAKDIEKIDFNADVTRYVPYLQAILADRDHLIARGDLFTPAQNTKAFKRYLDESGPVVPGDVTPTSNKAFNDLLHPLGDFGSRWADKFFNEFLLKLYQFVPAAEKFKHFIDEHLTKPRTPSKAPDVLTRAETQDPGLEAHGVIVDTSTLIKAFAAAYNNKIVAERKENSSIFRFFSHTTPEPNLLPVWQDMENKVVLEAIFNSAFGDQPSKRTKEVLIQLKWITADGKSLSDWAGQVKQLKEAFRPFNKDKDTALNIREFLFI